MSSKTNARESSLEDTCPCLRVPANADNVARERTPKKKKRAHMSMLSEK